MPFPKTILLAFQLELFLTLTLHMCTEDGCHAHPPFIWRMQFAHGQPKHMRKSWASTVGFEFVATLRQITSWNTQKHQNWSHLTMGVSMGGIFGFFNKQWMSQNPEKHRRRWRGGRRGGQFHPSCSALCPSSCWGAGKSECYSPSRLIRHSSALFQLIKAMIHSSYAMQSTSGRWGR